MDCAFPFWWAWCKTVGDEKSHFLNYGTETVAAAIPWPELEGRQPVNMWAMWVAYLGNVIECKLAEPPLLLRSACITERGRAGRRALRAQGSRVHTTISNTEMRLAGGGAGAHRGKLKLMWEILMRSFKVIVVRGHCLTPLQSKPYVALRVCTPCLKDRVGCLLNLPEIYSDLFWIAVPSCNHVVMYSGHLKTRGDSEKRTNFLVPIIHEICFEFMHKRIFY